MVQTRCAEVSPLRSALVGCSHGAERLVGALSRAVHRQT